MYGIGVAVVAAGEQRSQRHSQRERDGWLSQPTLVVGSFCPPLPSSRSQSGGASQAEAERARAAVLERDVAMLSAALDGATSALAAARAERAPSTRATTAAASDDHHHRPHHAGADGCEPASTAASAHTRGGDARQRHERHERHEHRAHGHATAAAVHATATTRAAAARRAAAASTAEAPRSLARSTRYASVCNDDVPHKE